MSTAVLVLPIDAAQEEFLDDYEVAILMVDAAILARAIAAAEREPYLAAVFVAINLVRIRRGTKEIR